MNVLAGDDVLTIVQVANQRTGMTRARDVFTVGCAWRALAMVCTYGSIAPYNQTCSASLGRAARGTVATMLSNCIARYAVTCIVPVRMCGCNECMPQAVKN